VKTLIKVLKAHMKEDMMVMTVDKKVMLRHKRAGPFQVKVRPQTKIRKGPF